MALNDNALFLFDNLADSAISLTASSAEVNMPVSNLQNTQRSLVWRSTASFAQTFDLTLNGSDYSHIAFVDHNFPQGTTVLVQGWSDAINGTNEVFNVQLDPWSYDTNFANKLIGASGVYNGPNDGYLQPVFVIDLAGVHTAAYVRIRLDNTTEYYYQFGRLFVANAWQPTYNMNFGWSMVLNDNSNYKKTAFGNEYGNILPNNTELNLTFSWLNNDERDELAVRRLLNGTRKPIIMQLRPNGTAERMYMSLYGRLKNLPFSSNFPNTTISRIQFSEDL